jgi:membrane associated rhomboid family serine protease
MIGIAISSLCVGIFDVKQYLHLQVRDPLAPFTFRWSDSRNSWFLIFLGIIRYAGVLIALCCATDLELQYWRLLVHHGAYTNSSDLFLAELLFYNLGTVVERRFGSVKFAVSIIH